MLSIWNSRLNLLEELECVTFVTVEEAYQEYLGKLPQNYHPDYSAENKARKEFVDSLLGKNTGLPVLIVTTEEDRYVVLYDECGKASVTEQLQVLCDVLNKRTGTHARSPPTSEILAVMKLASTAKEKALLLSLLSLTHTHTALRHTLGIDEHHLCKIRTAVMDYSKQIDIEKEAGIELSEEEIDGEISRLEQKLK